MNEEVVIGTMPTEEELINLNPDGIEINMDMIAEDVQMEGEDLVQDNFNEDGVEQLLDESVEVEVSE